METAQPLRVLIDRFHQHQQAVGRATGTIERYHYSFLLFDRFLASGQITADSTSLTSATMERFAIWLRDTPVKPQHGTTKRAESGIHAHLRDLRAFANWLHRQGLLERTIHFPMPRIPRHLFRILTDDELQRVWSSHYLTGNSSRSIRNRAMISLMLDTGLRREEVAGLTLDSISLERRRLTVIGKGNKERQMVFSAAVRDRLKQFLAIRGIDDEPLFHLSADGIRTTFRRIQEDVGLEKFHPHQLRHQFATAMLREGIHLEVIGVMLGHEDYNTTRQYVSLDETDMALAHAKASPFEALMQRVDEPTDPPSRRVRYSSKETA
jgi:site-specific recombinase XerD